MAMQRTMEFLKIALGIGLLLFLAHGTLFYYLQRAELEGVGRMRAEYAGEVAKYKMKYEEKSKEFDELSRQEALLRERLNTLIDESRTIPDLRFLETLAQGKLANLDTLDDDAYLASTYRGRPVILENLVADDFYTKPGADSTTLKFRGAGCVARAHFPHAHPANGVTRSLDRKMLHRVSFIGKIKDWNGRFDIDDARLLSYIAEPADR